MNLDPLSFTLSQITHLVGSLSSKNQNQVAVELQKLVTLHGLDADRHLFRCLFTTADFSESSAKAPPTTCNQLLLEYCSCVINKPSLVSTVCLISDFTSGKPDLVASKLFQQLSKCLHLTIVQEVVFALALLQSANKDISGTALVHLRTTVPLLLKSYIDSGGGTNPPIGGGLNECSPELLHFILSAVLVQPIEYGVTNDLYCSFVNTLKSDFPTDLVPVVLAPLLYSQSSELPPDPSMSVTADLGGVLAPSTAPPPPSTTTASSTSQPPGGLTMLESSLPDLLAELGSTFTSSIEECKKGLVKLAGCDISSAIIARILSVMCRTPAPSGANASDNSLSDNTTGSQWNVDIFVKAIKDINPNGIQWTNVVQELDHADFLIKDRNSLVLLITGLRKGLQSAGYHPDSFPVDQFYRRWANVEGQFSLVQCILKNPDVFCFGDYPCLTVSVDVLKTPPPEQDMHKELANWRSLNLIELLLHLSECGLLFTYVQDLFKYPVHNCPDVLALGLLQIASPVTLLRQELLTNLMPIFLVNHPNSGIVLHHAWNSTNISAMKSIIMHSMNEWYVRADGDQARLSRILDVAQDLKALSMLLNVQNTQLYPFLIDLACLASRREYLKLEKWLSDKIRDNGDPFVMACIKFLHRRSPLVALKNDDSGTKATGFPLELLTTIMICLQSSMNMVSPECQEAIITMTTNCAMLLKSRQQVVGGLMRRDQGGTATAALSQSTMGAPGSPFSHAQLQFTGHSDLVVPSLATSLANLTLPGSGGGFNLPTANLGPLVPSPGSPSRAALLSGSAQPPPAATTNQFQLINMQQQQQQNISAAMQVPTSYVLGVNQVAQIGRMTSTASTAITATAGIPTAGTPVPPSAITSTQIQQSIDQSYNLFPEFSQPVSKDIEVEANSYFQRIYNHHPQPNLSIDEVLEMLKKFQESNVKREREVFQCMIRNLFEEYKFFPQYPEKELYITAQLFGGIIERGIVTSYIALGLALKYVLEALKKPEGSKMYYFGITALDRFKCRLKDYNKYCEHVKSLQHFSEFPQHLQEYIEYGLQSLEPPNKPQGTTIPSAMAAQLPTHMTPGTSTSTMTIQRNQGGALGNASSQNAQAMAGAARPSIANATNIDTLLVATEKEEKVITPPETLQDKTAFIFNNLSQLNLKTKCDELRELITEDYYSWLAQYLVMKRASIELNFHALYSNFLDTLNIPDIYRLVTRETFRNIKVLLRSDKGIENFSDRSLLKNLGHWLGMLTLARSRPILQIDLDLKALLAEAYHKGQQELLYVVPFVAKVVESCAKSKVFKPQNPWTMAIMNILAELHQEPELKLTLKFEIEVLCKNLDLDVSQLKPIVYLKDPQRMQKIVDYQLSHPSHSIQHQILVAKSHKEVIVPNVPPPSIPPPSTTTSNNASAIAANTIASQMLNTGTSNEQDLNNMMQNQQQHQQQQQQAQGQGNSPIIMTSANSGTPTSVLATPPEPRFSYSEIQQMNGVAAIQPHILINPSIALFQNQPHLKPLVRSAVEHAIQEWICLMVDRSIKISLQTCEHIIRKDFALHPDENQMRLAAHFMVRNLAAGMTMITCRDQLISAISSHLKQALIASLGTPNVQQKELIDQAATLAAADNMELACCLLQKTSIEKAIPEIDKRLMNEYELRKLARQEGRRYFDPVALAYQSERMPEPIRSKVGGITSSQMAVYEEFARNIPGFQSSERDVSILMQKVTTLTPIDTTPTHTGTTQFVGGAPSASIPSDDLMLLFDKFALDIEQYIQLTSGQSMCSHINNHMLVIRDCLLHILRTRELAPPQVIVQKCVESLQDCLNTNQQDNENYILRFKELILRILKSIQDPRVYGQQWTNKLVTRLLTECRDEYRYNIDAVDTLVKAGLVHIPQYDAALSQCIESSLNLAGVTFAMQLVQLYLVDDRGQNIGESDLSNTVDMLGKIQTHSRHPPDGLSALMEMLRQNNEVPFFADRQSMAPTVHMHNGILQVRTIAFEDPPAWVEKIDFLFREWLNVSVRIQEGGDVAKLTTLFLHQLNLQGILKTDESITRFFRIITQICVDNAYRIVSEKTSLHMSLERARTYPALDAYARLIALLVRNSGDNNSVNAKAHLVNKILGVIAGCLLQDHENRKLDFNQLPYQRIFSMSFLEFNNSECGTEAVGYQILNAFCHALHILRPAKAPGFCYAWLELISNRIFLSRMLASSFQQKCWPLYAQLLIDLFKFLSPFLRNADLAKPVTILYKGTLRVLLVLLHDFPEFLCDYHYGFCDVIPPNCIQMRNLILSAFPRNMRLPDPFTPNLKVDMLPEIACAPRIMTNIGAVITPPQFKKELETYLKNRAPVTFLSELRSNLQISNDPGVRYNIVLMNALVLHVGMQAITHIRGKGQPPNMTTIAHSAHMDIFQNLAVDLDTEGRYLFLNAIANQLRYPNSHTHYFSCTLLYLFAEANTEAIQEQITRVLLERLIVNRPHPWGLLITFIELIKNPTYKFWNHEFVHCAPEIEKLFESVARSCMVSKNTLSAQEGNEVAD